MSSSHNKLPNLETIITATKAQSYEAVQCLTLKVLTCLSPESPRQCRSCSPLKMDQSGLSIEVTWPVLTNQGTVLPKALSLPPAPPMSELTSTMGVPEVTSTIGDRQLSFLRRPRPGAGPPSASQMSWVRISLHRPSLPSLAVSTSRNICSTCKTRW